MILELVDRRGRDPGPADRWAAAQRLWSRLAGGVAQLGQAGWSVDLVLVDDGEMRDLNRRFRNRNEVTDVLSFSYLAYAGEGPCDLTAGCGRARVDCWLDGVAANLETAVGQSVGEVVLAPGFVSERCGRHGWDLEDEIALLVFHGCLHLLGWEHEQAAERLAMQDEEAGLLRTLGLEHPLRRRS